MYSKEFSAEILKKEGLAATPKLIKIMEKEEISEYGVLIKRKIKVTLMNLQQKPVLTYVDKLEKSFSEQHNMSKIYCYNKFFVRQVENYYMFDLICKKEKKAAGYLVYDYNGKMLGCGKGSWLESLKKEDNLYELYDE